MGYASSQEGKLTELAVKKIQPWKSRFSWKPRELLRQMLIQNSLPASPTVGIFAKIQIISRVCLNITKTGGENPIILSPFFTGDIYQTTPNFAQGSPLLGCPAIRSTSPRKGANAVAQRRSYLGFFIGRFGMLKTWPFWMVASQWRFQRSGIKRVVN